MKTIAKPGQSGVAVRPFIVEEKWVEITVSIEAWQVPFFEARTRMVRNRLGENVWLFLWDATRMIHPPEGYVGESDETKAAVAKVYDSAKWEANLRGCRLLPLRVTMLELFWNDIQQLPRVLKLPARALIRAGLRKRLHELVLFDEREAKGGTA